LSSVCLHRRKVGFKNCRPERSRFPRRHELDQWVPPPAAAEGRTQREPGQFVCGRQEGYRGGSRQMPGLFSVLGRHRHDLLLRLHTSDREYADIDWDFHGEFANSSPIWPGKRGRSSISSSCMWRIRRPLRSPTTQTRGRPEARDWLLAEHAIRSDRSRTMAYNPIFRIARRRIIASILHKPGGTLFAAN
jgi:hypothetical protein